LQPSFSSALSKDEIERIRVPHPALPIIMPERSHHRPGRAEGLHIDAAKAAMTASHAVIATG
jgi:hypothetical protein